MDISVTKGRLLDHGRRYRCSGKRQVPGGARVRCDDALQPVVAGSARRRIDTHVRHHAADGQTGDLARPQQLQQVRLAKAVGMMLADDRFTGQGTNTAVETDTGRAGSERGRFGIEGNVLDEDGGQVIVPEMGEQLLGLNGCFDRAIQRHGATREVLLLDVDEQQSRFHWSGCKCTTLGYLPADPKEDPKEQSRAVILSMRAW